MTSTIKKLLFVLPVILIQVFMLTPHASAEDIPVLIWERGQTQNVVMGVGSSNQNWELYLVGDNQAKFAMSKSFKNKDGFYVYSIDLSSKFVLGGYIVEAISTNGETKQVAGIQIIQPVIKDVTRIPAELLLILIGFSFFAFVLNYSRMQNLKFPTYKEISFEKAHRENLLTRKFRFWIEHNSNNSLLRNLLLDDFKFENRYAPYTSIAGLVATLLIIIAQLQTGNWLTGSSALIAVALVLSNASITFGLLNLALSVMLSLLNISLARSMSEVISLIVISSIALLPNLYNQFLHKFLATIFKANSNGKLQAGNLLSAGMAGLVSYQLLLLFESLSVNVKASSMPKLFIALTLFLFFSAKNYLNSSEFDDVTDFEITRSISPIATAIVGVLIGLVGYIWTSNLLIALISFLSCTFILTLNWLKFNSKLKISLPIVTLPFGAALILLVFIALFTTLRYLPLDVVNRSNLMVLLTFPLDLLLAIYMSLSTSSRKEQSLQ